ncbi:MAG: phytanoyl-CoA dioxygenase family protein [Alphaproteobacteria bacterium]
MTTPDRISSEIQENGFAIIRGAFSKDAIGQIFADIAQMLDIALRSAGIEPDKQASVDEKYLRLKDGAPRLKGHAYDLLGRLDSVQRAIWSSPISQVGRTLYSTPLLLGPVQIRIDDSSNDRLLPMHQELEQISLLSINFWLPLVDVAPGAGTLRIVPGSHRRGLRPHVRLAELAHYFSLDPAEYAGETTETLTMSAGDLLLFHPFLFHGSDRNSGTHIRWTLVSRLTELNTCPYLRSADAPLIMDRNPDPSAPGNDFVRDFAPSSR